MDLSLVLMIFFGIILITVFVQIFIYVFVGIKLLQLGILGSVLCILIGFHLLGAGASRLWYQWQLANYHETTCAIINIMPDMPKGSYTFNGKDIQSYCPVFLVSYQPNHSNIMIHHTAKLDCVTGKETQTSLLENYHVGQTLPCWEGNINGKEVVLKRKYDYMAGGWRLLLGIILMYLGFNHIRKKKIVEEKISTLQNQAATENSENKKSSLSEDKIDNTISRRSSHQWIEFASPEDARKVKNYIKLFIIFAIVVAVLPYILKFIFFKYINLYIGNI